MSGSTETAVAVRRNASGASASTLDIVRSRFQPIALRGLVRQSVSYANYGLEKIGALGIIGAALGIVSVALFLSTIQPLREQIRLQLATMSDIQSTQARAAISPVSQNPFDGFLSSLPARDDLPAVLGQVLGAAEQADFELERGNYEFQLNTNSGQVERYQLVYPVVGTYPQIRTFIESALAAVPTMALAQISLERDSTRTVRVSADITFTVFVRGQL